MLRVLDAAHLLPHRRSSFAFPATAVLVLAVALPVAMVSYRWIERTGMTVAAAFDQAAGLVTTTWTRPSAP